MSYDFSHNKRFREAFQKLPNEIKEKAKEAYILWQVNPYNKGLHFKKIHSIKPIYSVRINIDFRACGIKEGEHLVWFWIGSHEDYNKIISQS